MKIGITGDQGFAGRHLAAALRQCGDTVPAFDRAWFAEPEQLAEWAAGCDRIVHFAGLSRHADGELLYRTNMELARTLDAVLRDTPRPLYFASTTHFAKDLPYHRSKRDARSMFEISGRYPVVTLRMANLFGPGSRPFYNSVVSSFCALAAAGKTPETVNDAELQLLYIDELTDVLTGLLHDPVPETAAVTIPHRHTVRLPELWRKLVVWRETPPAAPEGFDRLLWTTFQSYLIKESHANSDLECC